MRKLKDGDRVVVYSSVGRRIGCVTGFHNGMFRVMSPPENGSEFFYHPKQMRRLKPKPKPREPRRVWVKFSNEEDLCDTYPTYVATKEEAHSLGRTGYVEFIEVIGKKK